MGRFVDLFFHSVTLIIIFLCSALLCVKDVSELRCIKTTLLVLNSHKVLIVSFLSVLQYTFLLLMHAASSSNLKTRQHLANILDTVLQTQSNVLANISVL